MSLKQYPKRFLVATAAPSVLLLASTVAVAVYLSGERARTAAELRENTGSRRAAVGLDETLVDLLTLRVLGVGEVATLNDRASYHIDEINRYVNKEEERSLARQVDESFQRYLELARNGQGSAATTLLRTETLPSCRRLRNFNTDEELRSEQAHNQANQWLMWGFAAVGTLGSSAGLLLGYGLARSLQRAVDSLLVQVQGASDLLGQELATVRVEQLVGTDRDGIENLVARVGEVVRTLQQREREVRRAERLAAVGQLAAGVAHEIRNPLTSVQLLIQTARRDPTAGGLDSNDLALIDAELGRIEHSLQEFLDYARPAKPERKACEPATIVRDALNLIRARAEQQSVEIRFKPPQVPVVLFADPQQLQQVMLNLVLNALDAMTTGGILEVDVKTVAGGVELIVRDTGTGIAPEILPRLFEPFATSKETGLGLGLVVSKRIIEDHGGTMSGLNLPNRGAQFTVHLPA